MLVVNRYENRQTGKVTIQAHVIKGKKLIKSYAPCCYSLIDMIAQNYSFYLLCDVDYYSKLKTVKIVNAWSWFSISLLFRKWPLLNIRKVTMNIKHILRIKQRALYESKDLLSSTLFSTKKHSYTLGDMITLFSFMTLLCAFVYISLIIGIK